MEGYKSLLYMGQLVLKAVYLFAVLILYTKTRLVGA